jgi:hypothetical protein
MRNLKEKGKWAAVNILKIEYEGRLGYVRTNVLPSDVETPITKY